MKGVGTRKGDYADRVTRRVWSRRQRKRRQASTSVCLRGALQLFESTTGNLLRVRWPDHGDVREGLGSSGSAPNLTFVDVTTSRGEADGANQRHSPDRQEVRVSEVVAPEVQTKLVQAIAPDQKTL